MKPRDSILPPSPLARYQVKSGEKWSVHPYFGTAQRFPQMLLGFFLCLVSRFPGLSSSHISFQIVVQRLQRHEIKTTILHACSLYSTGPTIHRRILTTRNCKQRLRVKIANVLNQQTTRGQERCSDTKPHESRGNLPCEHGVDAVVFFCTWSLGGQWTVVVGF